jgi:hypothetical protein
MGGAYPYMDLNAKYEKLYYDVFLESYYRCKWLAKLTEVKDKYA